MKTKTTLKSSTVALTLGLLALSGQLSADERSQGLWDEQFQNAYNGVSAQASTGPGSSVAPIWAGHFEEANVPSTERTTFASFTADSEVAGDDVVSSRSESGIDYLLWRSMYPL